MPISRTHLLDSTACLFRVRAQTQAIWDSIGYTLGALLGTLKAAPERRHILLIGDGSFQLTAQELSTILRHGLKPLIFLINNGGYTKRPSDYHEYVM
jgi:TPP-dependent 2-oxoacid decarboxylase